MRASGNRFPDLKAASSKGLSGSGGTSLSQPNIVVNFSGYTPPYNVARAASRVIATIPPKFLVGLGAVVLTNSDCLSHDRRNRVNKPRSRKGKSRRLAGLYHQAWQGDAAWVEIFLDTTLSAGDKEKWIFKVPLFRDIFLSRVLFHEIGHHIHYTVRPEFREKEAVADSWRDRLQKNYKRYPYPVRIFIKYVGRLILLTMGGTDE